MHKRWLHLVLLIVVAAGVFFNTLHNDFHIDDHYQLVDNPGIQTLSRPWRHFVDLGTKSTLPTVGYRPFLPLTLSINYRLHKYSLPGYHLVNFIFHIIAGILVYFLCLELLTHWAQNKYEENTRRDIALVVSLLFTIHPVAGISVNYISSRDLILMQMFLLGSFLAYVRMRRLGMTPVRWAFVLFLFVCSMLSKQNGVTAPALILIFEFTLVKQRLNDIRAWARAIPFALVVLAYFAFSKFYLGSSSLESAISRSWSSSWTYPLTQAKVHLTHYFFNFFWPWSIRQSPYVEAAKSLFEPEVILGIIFILATLLVAWRMRRENPLLTFCILGYWTALAPTSSFISLHYLAEHYRPYPASHLFFLAFALVAVKFLKDKPLVLISAPFILYFAFASVWLNKNWKTEESLWTHSVKYGGTHIAHFSLAINLKNRRDPRVRAHLEQALRMSPNFAIVHIVLGLLMIDFGEPKGGLAHVLRAVHLSPNDGQTHFWLSHAYTRLGRHAEAAMSSAQAVLINPRNFKYQYKAARDAQRVGDYKGSLEYLEACEEILPGHGNTYFLRGFALQKIGNLDGAVKYYRMHLGLDPGNKQAEFNLAHALMTLGECQEAIGHFKRTLEIAPNYREVHLHLASCYEKIGNREEQEKHLALYSAVNR